MKKLATLSAIALAFVLTMGVAFARGENNRCCDDRRHKDDCCPKVEVKNDNDARIDNKVTASSNSGMNYSGGTEYRKNSRHSYSASGLIETGKADALADAKTTVNDTYIEVTAPRRGEVEIGNDNYANVNNYVSSSANSGTNRVSRGTVRTGEAVSTGYAMTMANSTMIVVK